MNRHGGWRQSILMIIMTISEQMVPMVTCHIRGKKKTTTSPDCSDCLKTTLTYCSLSGPFAIQHIRVTMQQISIDLHASLHDP